MNQPIQVKPAKTITARGARAFFNSCKGGQDLPAAFQEAVISFSATQKYGGAVSPLTKPRLEEEAKRLAGTVNVVFGGVRNVSVEVFVKSDARVRLSVPNWREIPAGGLRKLAGAIEAAINAAQSIIINKEAKEAFRNTV